MDFFKFLLYVYVLLGPLAVTQNYITAQNISVFPIKNYVLASTSILNYGSMYTKRSTGDCLHIMLQTGKRPYELCIYQDEYSRKEINILLYKNFTEQYWNPYDLGISLVSGYVLSYPYDSFIKGYIKSNKFYGKVFVENNLFYVEELNSYQILFGTQRENRTKNAIIYVGSNDNMMVNIVYANESFRVYDRLRFQKMPLFKTTNMKSKG